MVNLTIRLSKAGASPGAKHEPVSTPATSEGPSIPPHLVDVDLPLAKGLGILNTDACGVNFVGVKARRRPGDKVHICVRCNFPIAVYGRLVRTQCLELSWGPGSFLVPELTSCTLWSSVTSA